MITMNELVDLRLHQHIAHEIYRQQIMQRIPDPFPSMLPMHMPRHVIMPPRVTLPGVEVTLQNDDLWKKFHQIGTEMIITKSGRRMFPSMRLALSGLEEESNYCVLLEMIPIGDCRYKFSGSQWVPAGGAEPQSPQRMCLHPDSPASGSHWQAQPILFNKVKLTNNTLDNNGHIVLASMHKYQPRLHVIRTSDLTQIPWAPQQAFVFPETEFVAVTAYQNDRITKLKIDNNPFAKGFRETGQSRCKRKMSSSPTDDQDQEYSQLQQQRQQQQQQFQSDMSPTKFSTTMASDSASSICNDKTMSKTNTTNTESMEMALYNADADADNDDEDSKHQVKRIRSNGSACSALSSLDEEVNVVTSGGNSNGGGGEVECNSAFNANVCSFTSNSLSCETGLQNVAPSAYNLNTTATATTRTTYACHPPPPTNLNNAASGATSSFMHHFQMNMQSMLRQHPIYLQHMYPQHAALVAAAGIQQQQGQQLEYVVGGAQRLQFPLSTELPNNDCSDIYVDTNTNEFDTSMLSVTAPQPQEEDLDVLKTPTKRKSFTISAILGDNS